MDKNKKSLFLCFGLFFTMIALSYASVPLYSLFCKVTGYGGTTQKVSANAHKIIDRKIKITFTAQTDPDLPWEFKPQQSSITVKVGETGLAFYSAKNLSPQRVTGMAVYNVTPDKAGKYFNKIHCFCFDQQSLDGKKEMPMPVTFFIDPSFADDANMKDVEEINLNYIFYKQ